MLEVETPLSVLDTTLDASVETQTPNTEGVLEAALEATWAALPQADRWHVPALWDFSNNTLNGDATALAEVMRPHLLNFEESTATLLDALEKGDPFSAIRLADSDVYACLWPYRNGREQASLHEKITWTGVIDPTLFPEQEYLKLLDEADFISVQHPDLAPPALWAPALEFLLRSRRLTQRKWLEMHPIYRLTADGRLFKHFRGKKVVWVGAKAPIFLEYFKNEKTYQDAFPQLQLPHFELIALPTPEISTHALGSLAELQEAVRATYEQKPDYFLFSAGLLSRYLAIQVKQDGFIGMDMGATLDNLMGLPVHRPHMDIFHRYQHPNLVLDCPESFYIETIRHKEENRLVFERTEAPRPKLWDFGSHTSRVDNESWALKFNPHCVRREETQEQVVQALSSGKPFSYFRLTDLDAAACLRDTRSEAELATYPELLYTTGLIDPNSFDITTFKNALLQADMVSVQQPYNAPPQLWLPGLEALLHLELLDKRTWYEIHALYAMTTEGTLFRQFRGKKVVWIGAKTPIFHKFFYQNLAYHQAFPQLYLDDIDLSVLATPEIGGNIMSTFQTVRANLETEVYPNKPDVILVSAGLMSRFLVHEARMRGFTVLDMGAAIDNMMNLPVKRPYMKPFDDFQHPDIVINSPDPFVIDSIYCKKTGDCLYHPELKPTLD